MEENLDLAKNTDINKALLEFETKAQVEQIQKTPENKIQKPNSKMVSLVIKLSGGLIKNEGQANYVLFGIMVVMIVSSVVIVLNSGSKPRIPTSAEDKVIYSSDTVLK